MDIFGTVVSAIDLTKKVIDYVQKARDAFEECSKVLFEVSSLQPLLTILHSRMPSDGQATGLSTLLINAGLESHLKNCVSSLQFLENKLKPSGDKKLDSLVFRLTWPFKKGEIEEHLQKLERLKSLIVLACQSSLLDFVVSVEDDLRNLNINVTAASSALQKVEEKQQSYAQRLEAEVVDVKALGFKITDGLCRLNSGQEALSRKVDSLIDENELRKHRTWLSNTNFSDSMHTSVSSQFTPETANWFVEHGDFQSWKSANGGILWCYGDPGAGKTFIATATINYLQNEFDASDTKNAVLFFYFDFKANSGSSISDIFRDILKQFGKYGFTMKTSEKLSTFQRNGKHPSDSELSVILEEEIRSYEQTFIIIDALDEYSENSRYQLLHHLKELSSSGLNVLVTSRNLLDIKNSLRGYLSVHISAQEDDMTKYIESRIRNGRHLTSNIRRKPSLRNDIVSSVIQRADKMFLQVKLHMDSLELQSSPKKLLAALKELPWTLGQTYEDILNKISQRGHSSAFTVFSWMIHSSSTLSLLELKYALAASSFPDREIEEDDLDDEEYISTICAGLISIQFAGFSPDVLERFPQFREKFSSVRFVHYTIQEYFIQNSHFLMSSDVLANICLCFVVNSRTSPDASNIREFFRYANSLWADFTRSNMADENSQQMIMKLMTDRPRVRAILELMYDCSGYAVHLCVCLGLLDLLKHLIKEGMDVNENGSTDSFQDPLSLAVIYNRDDIAKFLCQISHLDVNFVHSALWKAVMSNKSLIVGHILQRHDVDINLVYHRAPVLHYAIRHKHKESVDVLLRKSDINVNYLVTPESHDYNTSWRSDIPLGTPLILSIQNGDCQITQALLRDERLQVNVEDYREKTAIFHAVQLGKSEIVEMILSIRDDVNCDITCKETGRSLVEIALENGDYETARLLTGLGRITSFRPGNTNLLCLAVGENDFENAKFILHSGEELVCTTNFLQEAEAFEKGLQNNLTEPSIIQFFLEHMGRATRSPLHGYAMLYSNPVHFANTNGYTHILQLLLERDEFDINGLTPYFGATALHIAAEFLDASHVLMLLNAPGINPNITDVYGRTPLMLAWHWSETDTVKMLMEYSHIDTMLDTEIDDRPSYPIHIYAARKSFSRR